MFTHSIQRIREEAFERADRMMYERKKQLKEMGSKSRDKKLVANIKVCGFFLFLRCMIYVKIFKKFFVYNKGDRYMRVLIKRSDDRAVVVEIVQFIKFKEDNILGLILPYSSWYETRNYNFYKSTTPVEDRDYNYWCEQLTRNGYLDLTRTDLLFDCFKAK